MSNTTLDLPACPDQLSAPDLARFRENGYLAFADILPPEELAEVRAAMRDIFDRLVSGPGVEFTPPSPRTSTKSGGATYKFRDSRCFIQLETGVNPEGLTPDEIELSVRKYMHFVQAHPALARLVQPGHAIRRVVESLIGPDPILFQEMGLVKPPLVGTEKPWHQDNAYFSVAPLEGVIGVWIALDDAEVENGCMHVIPGGHRLGALKHFHSTDCEIIPDRFDTTQAVAVPVPAGGAMFFYGLLPHQTPPNRSSSRRRALQFHFRAATSKVVDADTYNHVFAEADGTPASCKAASGSR